MTRTKGNIIVEDIKVGDIHYEFEYGMCFKSQVLTIPEAEQREDDTYWTWTSKNLKTGETISYGVSSKYSHYGPNLYDHEAYAGCDYI